MNKSTYEQELERTGKLIYTTVGTSMRPFIRSQEDLVVIERRPDLRYEKYDAVLYRRDSGQYVLHRIVKVGADGYTMCGDNRAWLEPGIRQDQILGVLTAVIRQGQRIDVNTEEYRREIRRWVAWYPVRAVILKIKGLWNRRWKKRKENA